jgi:hypothetical protein
MSELVGGGTVAVSIRGRTVTLEIELKDTYAAIALHEEITEHLRAGEGLRLGLGQENVDPVAELS